MTAKTEWERQQVKTAIVTYWWKRSAAETAAAATAADRQKGAAIRRGFSCRISRQHNLALSATWGVEITRTSRWSGGFFQPLFLKDKRDMAPGVPFFPHNNSNASKLTARASEITHTSFSLWQFPPFFFFSFLVGRCFLLVTCWKSKLLPLSYLDRLSLYSVLATRPPSSSIFIKIY